MQALYVGISNYNAEQAARAVHDPRFLRASDINENRLAPVRKPAEIADRRGESVAQLAIQWVLRDPVVTSALVGASRPEQIEDNVKAVSFPALTKEELDEIDAILAER